MKKNYRLSRPCIDLLMDLQALESKKAKRHLTYGAVIERAASGILENEAQNGNIDWLRLAEESDLPYSDISSISSRQETSPIGISLEKKASEVINQIKMFSEEKFALKRSGGVYVGVAIRYLLLAYLMLLEEGKESLPRC